jgi:hypothetical protein
VGITQIEGIQGAIAPADHHKDAIENLSDRPFS